MNKVRNFPTVTATGSAYEVGFTHATKTLALREAVEAHVNEALSTYPPRETDRRIRELTETLSRYSPDTLGQLEGMAAGYQLDPRDMLTAVLQTYFQGVRRSVATADQGCSVYAHASTAGAVLVKTRDADPKFADMQTVIRVREREAYSWLALSTAGAPGVHSAGMNETGLSIADTHVPATDTGPGLPRFSMMMEVLKKCSSTEQAVNFIRQTPNMGYGNLVVLDQDGARAVIECGFHTSAVIQTDASSAVATNHFVSAETRDTCLEPEQTRAGRDTRLRRTLLAEHVKALSDNLLADPLLPMRRHTDDEIGSTCVHASEHEPSSTIAAIAMEPGTRSVTITHQQPCINAAQQFSANPDLWTE